MDLLGETLEKLKKIELLRAMTVKAVKPFISEIPRLTDLEIEELKKKGIKLKGLFQNIEPETMKIAEAYAEFYINRYEDYAKEIKKKDPQKFQYLVRKGRYNPDGTLPEKRKVDQRRMGITQKAFEIALQQLQVPYIPNDPTIDWRPKKDRPKDPTESSTKFSFDFYIPFLGKIDIKSATWDSPKVNINCREFKDEKPDLVVAYYILEGWEYLKLPGFLTRTQIVESYEPIPMEPEYRTFRSIPIEDFEKEEHDGIKLCRKLLEARGKIKLFEQMATWFEEGEESEGSEGAEGNPEGE
jgi:hypothetical protein